jgi:hypothetical protein
MKKALISILMLPWDKVAKNEASRYAEFKATDAAREYRPGPDPVVNRE